MRSAYDRLPRSVLLYEDARQEVTRDLLRRVNRRWPREAPQDPAGWFARNAGGYATDVTMAQLETALISEWSVDNALAAQGMEVRDAPRTNPLGFASTDAAGRPVMGQAYASAGLVGGTVDAVREAGGDVAAARALAWRRAGNSLVLATQTILSDTSRSVKSARMLAQDTGWVRVLTPPSCPRCVVTAGKYHREATADFDRHPGCDCTQMPTRDEGPDWAVDARQYFDSLTEDEQNVTFGMAAARAIRDGADPAQVINARRGMSTTTDRFGYRRVATTEGTTKRGWASRYLRENYNASLKKQPGSRYRRMDRPRLTPEEIYRIAGDDRDLAMSLLHKNGYYLDASPGLTGRQSHYPRDRELQEAAARANERMKRRGVTPPRT